MPGYSMVKGVCSLNSEQILYITLLQQTTFQLLPLTDRSRLSRKRIELCHILREALHDGWPQPADG